jgi:SAM-dependent methyltransferase
MRPDMYDDMFEREQTYWWHVNKRRIAVHLLRQFASSAATLEAPRILDCGCGTGALLSELGPAAPAVGVDLSEVALALSHGRGLRDLVRADFAEGLPFASEAFDAVTALDVVEHVAADGGLMAELRRVLRPGGLLIVSVPAHRWMWSYWDDMAGHHHRYSRAEIVAKLAKAGFRVERATYSNSAILLPAIVVRALKNRRRVDVDQRSSDFVPLPGLVNALLVGLGSAEAGLIRRWSLPFGLSVVCVARPL